MQNKLGLNCKQLQNKATQQLTNTFVLHQLKHLDDEVHLIAGTGTETAAKARLHCKGSKLMESRKLSNLDEVSHVAGQLLNDSVVEPLDVLQQSFVILDDKVDGNALAPKAA